MIESLISLLKGVPTELLTLIVAALPIAELRSTISLDQTIISSSPRGRMAESDG